MHLPFGFDLSIHCFVTNVLFVGLNIYAHKYGAGIEFAIPGTLDKDAWRTWLFFVRIRNSTFLPRAIGILGFVMYWGTMQEES